MQVAVRGDVRGNRHHQADEETAVSLLADVHIDAYARIGSGARLTFIGLAVICWFWCPDPVADVVQGDGPR